MTLNVKDMTLRLLLLISLTLVMGCETDSDGKYSEADLNPDLSSEQQTQLKEESAHIQADGVSIGQITLSGNHGTYLWVGQDVTFNANVGFERQSASGEQILEVRIWKGTSGSQGETISQGAQAVSTQTGTRSFTLAARMPSEPGTITVRAALFNQAGAITAKAYRQYGVIGDNFTPDP